MRFNSKFKKQYDRPRKEFYPKATGLEVIVRNNDVEKAIRILKKKVALIAWFSSLDANMR